MGLRSSITGGIDGLEARQGRCADLRDRVFAASDAGAAVGRIADGLFVSVSCVFKARNRRRPTGETTARSQRCHVPPRLLDYHAATRKQVESRRDWTLKELRVWLLETHSIPASTTPIWQTLAQLDLTQKKTPRTQRGRTDRTLPRLPLRRRGAREEWRDNSPAWTQATDLHR